MTDLETRILRALALNGGLMYAPAVAELADNPMVKGSRETRLADTLTVVRSVIGDLERDGLAEKVPNRGTRITQAGADALRQADRAERDALIAAWEAAMTPRK